MINTPNIKNKTYIKRDLELLADGTFDEETIKNIFWNTREYLKSYKLLKEIADYLAHQTFKDRGLIYNSINVSYSKLKYNYLVSKEININQIPKTLFDDLFINFVDQVSSEKLREVTNISKKKLKQIISINFPNYKTSKDIVKLEADNKLDLMLYAIDKILHTLIVEPIFTQKQFINEFKNALEYVCQLLDIRIDLSKIFELFSNDIMICIIAILHGLTISLKDKEIAITSIYYLPANTDKDLAVKSDEVFLALFCKFTLNRESGPLFFQFPLIVTEGKAIDYINSYNFSWHRPVQEIFAKRQNEKLMLVNKI